MSRRPPGTRADYVVFSAITTRWADNDQYGHVNNVAYYGFFDSVINTWLIHHGGLDPKNGAVIGFAVESGCRYFRPLSFPDPIEAGLRVGHLGNSSVRYEVGIFSPGDDQAAAEGHFVHVFVGRTSQRPVPIPADLRTALQRLRLVEPG